MYVYVCRCINFIFKLYWCRKELYYIIIVGYLLPIPAARQTMQLVVGHHPCLSLMARLTDHSHRQFFFKVRASKFPMPDNTFISTHLSLLYLCIKFMLYIDVMYKHYASIKGWKGIVIMIIYCHYTCSQLYVTCCYDVKLRRTQHCLS